MYKNAVSTIEESELKRFSIEQKIVLSLVYEYERIYKFIGDINVKKFLDAYYLKNQIHLINILLCSVYDHRNINYTLSEIHAMLGKKVNFDAGKLMASKNINEFIENLQGTKFHGVLSKVSEENRTPFELEMQLELYYFIHVWESKNKLDKTNKHIMSKIIGTEIDLHNIIWIYRLKKYYDFEDSNIYAHLIPISYHLEKHELSKMVESKSVDELVNHILASKYKDTFSGVLTKVNSEKIEYAFFDTMNKLFRTLQLQYPNSLSIAVGYIYHKEIEIKNLISIIEGIKYKLEPKEIMEHLTFIKNGGELK